MNEFLIENGHFVQSGFCLIQAWNDFIALVNIDFLKEENSIKEYKDWEKELVNTAISISNDNQKPQMFKKGKINRVTNVEYLRNTVLEREFKELDKDEILKFRADPKGFSFKELLNHLWNISEEDKRDFHAVQLHMRNYYRELFEKILKEKQEDNKEEKDIAT